MSYSELNRGRSVSVRFFCIVFGNVIKGAEIIVMTFHNKISTVSERVDSHVEKSID